LKNKGKNTILVPTFW